MPGVLIAHIAGVPVEETLMIGAPPLSTAVAVLVAQWRSRRSEDEEGGVATRGSRESDE